MREALSAHERMTMSVVPPAVHGQILRMGLFGKAWAWAAPGSRAVPGHGGGGGYEGASIGQSCLLGG
jgi:hypothetical protein